MSGSAAVLRGAAAAVRPPRCRSGLAARSRVRRTPKPVAQKAQVCVACHGPDGNSTNPAMPSLAGQPAQFIATQLFMFREGNRKDPQMSPMAASSEQRRHERSRGVLLGAAAAPPARRIAAAKTARPGGA